MWIFQIKKNSSVCFAFIGKGWIFVICNIMIVIWMLSARRAKKMPKKKMMIKQMNDEEKNAFHCNRNKSRRTKCFCFFGCMIEIDYKHRVKSKRFVLIVFLLMHTVSENKCKASSLMMYFHCFINFFSVFWFQVSSLPREERLSLRNFIVSVQ